MRIIFLPQRQAIDIKPTTTAAMISLTEDAQSIAPLREDGTWGALLRMGVVDGEYDKAQIETFKEDFPIVFEGYINQERATILREFIKNLPNQVTTIYIHCLAGRSRSAAVAQYCYEIFNVPQEQRLPTPRKNETIYQLLHNPSKFQLLVDTHTKTQTYEPEKISITKKLLSFFKS